MLPESSVSLQVLSHGTLELAKPSQASRFIGKETEAQREGVTSLRGTVSQVGLGQEHLAAANCKPAASPLCGTTEPAPGLLLKRGWTPKFTWGPWPPIHSQPPSKSYTPLREDLSELSHRKTFALQG